MRLGCDQRGYLAGSLDFEVSFYQNAITRFLIGEKDNDRFRISQEDLPVVWDQLVPLNITLSEHAVFSDENTPTYHIANITREDGSDTFEYDLELSPFRVV